MTLESRLDAWSRGWRGPLLAALVAMIAGLPGLFAMPPLDRDESRFAQATAQMLETGDYVMISFQDQPRFKKPIGIHWMQALSVNLLSAPEDREIWAYRIPSLLGAMLAAAACAWGAAAFWGARHGLIAGALLGSTFLLSTEAFIAKTDAVLCGTTTLALAALGRIYAAANGGPAVGWRTKLLFWLGLAAATLVKGPVGPMVVAFTLAALWAWDRKAGWMKDLSWSWGLVLFFAVIGPWAIAITVATDGAFWGAAIGGDLAPKLAGGHERHGGLPGYYALLSPLLAFPASLLLPAALVLGWKNRAEPGVRFALCWLIPTWLLFELLPTKLVHYTLPAFGALAWLMAASLREPIGRKTAIAGIALLAFAAFMYAAVSVYGYVEFGAPADLAWTIITAALFAATAAAGGWLILRRPPLQAMAVAGVLGILAHGAFAAVLAPGLDRLWISRHAADALTRTGLDPREGVAPGPVAVTGYTEPSLIFALGTQTQLGYAETSAEAVAQGRPAIVEAREDADFRKALAARGLTPRPAGTVPGFDYSNGDEMKLTLYRGQPPKPAALPGPLP